MVLTASNMLPLGTPAPDFSLPDARNGRLVALADRSSSRALLVMFLCNHCPYVKHIASGLAQFARDQVGRGLGIVAINSNDAAAYPADAPEKMKEAAIAWGWDFPYLVDAGQDVALAHRAACTPDFFLFDARRRLAYRGRFDASRPESKTPVTGGDLRAAVDAVLAGRPVAGEQSPSLGCNIKWRTGNEPRAMST